jgi:hypothetical protein
MFTSTIIYRFLKLVLNSSEVGGNSIQPSNSVLFENEDPLHRQGYDLSIAFCSALHQPGESRLRAERGYEGGLGRANARMHGACGRGLVG